VHYSSWSSYLNVALGMFNLILCMIIFGANLIRRLPKIMLPRFRAWIDREDVPMKPIYFRTVKMFSRILPQLILHNFAALVVAGVIYARFHSPLLVWLTLAAFTPLVVYEARKYCDQCESYEALVFVTLAELLFDYSTIFNLLLVVACIMGLVWWEAWFCIVLFKAVQLSPSIRNVVKAVYIPIKSLRLTFALAIIVIYTFTIIGFNKFPNQIDAENCNTMLACFLSVLHNGFLQGAGILFSEEEPLDYSTADGSSKMWFDLLFWVIVTVCIVNMVFGIMIDTFASLRENEEARIDLIQNHCFICSIHRGDFPSQDVFTKHRETEHAIMEYAYFITYVECSKPNERNGYQSYVHDKIVNNDVSWFPINQCICLGGLTVDTEASVQDKLDELLSVVPSQLGDIQRRLKALETGKENDK